MSYNINVLAVIWLPLMSDGETLDESITKFSGTKTDSLDFFARKRTGYASFMAEASHGELSHTIVGSIEIWEALPLLPSGEVNYTAIINRITIDVLKDKQVDQIWLDSHTNNLHNTVQLGEESIMASKWGNTSNSDIAYNLPLSEKTYIILSFRSYNDTTCISAHYIGHQLERMLAKVNKKFVTEFCGSERVGKELSATTNGYFRCGNTHFPPNATKVYEYDSETLVDSDVLEWGGTTTKVNRQTWGEYKTFGYHYGWMMFWLKKFPRGDGQIYQGKKLTNWWRFLSNWDDCMAQGIGLMEMAEIPTSPTSPTAPTAPTSPTSPTSPTLPTLPTSPTSPPTTHTIVKPKCGAPCAKGIPPVSSISNGGIGAGNTGVGGGCNPIPRPTATTPKVNDVPDAAKNYGLYKIKVLEIAFFPVSGGKLDIAQTGDVSETLDFMRVKVRNMTKTAIEKLEAGSSYRKYSNPSATPICSYQVVGRIEILEPYPMRRGCEWDSQGFNPPLVDYEEILKRVNGKDWVNQQGVTQFWIYGYHGEKVVLWESNMSSAYGNASNSGRLAKELPIYNKTYTVYNYNYSREVDTILEDHTHQMEALLNFIDKRDETPEAAWGSLLFWGLFVGSDKSHKPKQINGRYRCGWTHYPPNGVEDYDWQNRNRVASDMFDWTPQGVGQARMVSAQDWNLNNDGGVEWKVKWLQSIPGPSNGLNHNGKPLTNWWIFYGDFDAAMGGRVKLTE